MPALIFPPGGRHAQIYMKKKYFSGWNSVGTLLLFWVVQRDWIRRRNWALLHRTELQFGNTYFLLSARGEFPFSLFLGILHSFPCTEGCLRKGGGNKRLLAKRNHEVAPGEERNGIIARRKGQGILADKISNSIINIETK